MNDLVERYEVACAATWAIRRERANERDERLHAFSAVLEADLKAKYDESLLAAHKAEMDLQCQVEDAKIAAGQAKLAAMAYTEFAEWKMPTQQFRLGVVSKPTGRTGRLEVCTRDSVFPETTGDYRRPYIGDIFMRINKKDGTPSLLFDSWRERETYRWKPLAK